MYSPKIDKQFIPLLYREAKELKTPMTKLINRIVREHYERKEARDESQGSFEPDIRQVQVG
ncbi:MAG TPA: hypothetical protein PLK94_01545 [Alphaproteobacteria bacterium]|nr:hypothetical protein [Alphaproteobacteria bacterium]HPQ42903.1 hypothetical protein [Syntrophales bacterium]